MKKTLSSSAILSGMFLFVILMSSFSLEYSREDSRDDKTPQVNKVEERYKQRLEKRKVRLEKRFKRTKSTAKRQKIQKRIRNIKQKHDDGFGSPIFGLLGLIFSILAAVLFFVFLGLLFSTGVGAAAGIGVLSPLIPLYVAIGGGVSAVLGLGLSITGIILNKKDPDKWTKRGLGIAGMIIGIIMVSIFAIALGIYMLFL